LASEKCNRQHHIHKKIAFFGISQRCSKFLRVSSFQAHWQHASYLPGCIALAECRTENRSQTNLPSADLEPKLARLAGMQLCSHCNV
ncbi:unnamed protein product, partial [Ixodes pacificus]